MIRDIVENTKTNCPNPKTDLFKDKLAASTQFLTILAFLWKKCSKTIIAPNGAKINPYKKATKITHVRNVNFSLQNKEPELWRQLIFRWNICFIN